MSKRFILPIVVFLMVMPALSQENYQQWQSYKTIKINTTSFGANVGNTVVKFPTLIKLGVADSSVFATAKSGGADVRFAKTDGTQLPYQIDSWDTTVRSAAIWVLLDTVKGNDTTLFRMYWGNSTASDNSNSSAVFDSANGFAGVYHLNDYADATPNLRNGSSDGTADTVGVIGRCRKFNGVAGDSIMVPGLMGTPPVVTLSCWVKPTYAPPVTIGLAGGDAISIGDAVAIRVDSLYAMAGFYYTGSGWNFDTSLAAPGLFGAGWTYLTFVCDPGSSNIENFINGDLSGTQSYSPSIVYALGSSTYIGHHGNGQAAYNFGGLIDEARIENVVRSLDWIRLCFATQAIGQTTVTLGPTIPTSAVLFTPTHFRNLAGFNVIIRGNTTLFRLPADVDHPKVSIVDLSGRTLMIKNAERGVQEISWKGNLPVGAYIVHFSAVDSRSGEPIVIEKKIVLNQ